jgi:homogentisate 1,2-dioxygenase
VHLSVDQNSPIKLKKGVFAEQLSGTAFTMKRAENQKSWLYKVRPSVTQGQFKESNFPFRIIESYLHKENLSHHPNQLRWKAIPEVKEGKVNFIEGLVSIMGAG